jgi:hypothetical protein
MKYILTLFFVFIAAGAGMAQPAYPTAPAAPPNLGWIEYFVNTDPGVGREKMMALPAAQQLSGFSFDVDITGLPRGFHRIYFRAADVTGRWSVTDYRFFDYVVVPAYPSAPAPAPDIVAVEYFVDVDPGVGNGTPIPLAPGTDLSAQNLMINVTGLAAGVHQVFIRTKDASGKWSLTSFAQFDNSSFVPYPSAPADAPPVGEIEFYIDNDPGFGNGTPVNFAAGTDINNLSIDIPLASVAPGRHTIYFRSRQNPWSLSAYAEFVYGSALPVTWLYVRGSMERQSAVLTWATASEQNTSHFIVECSSDGAEFSSVGEIKAAGNSSSSKTYSFTHTNPASGFLYYRLKQVDLDGKYTYSKVIRLFNGTHLQASVVGPNPVLHTVHLIEPSHVLVKKIQVHDMSGRIVLTKVFESVNNNFSVSLADLSAGNYVLTVHYQDRVQSFKIVKQ